MKKGIRCLLLALLLLAPASLSPRGAPPPQDSERGCCVWKTDPVKCVYATRAFCRANAEKKHVKYTFRGGKDCKQQPECPKDDSQESSVVASGTLR